MKSKRGMLAVASLLLVMMLCLPLVSQAGVTETWHYNGYNYEFNRLSGTIAVWEGSMQCFVLYDRYYNQLTTVPYTSISSKAGNALYEVAVSSELNRYGVIDAQGNQLLPMQYGDVEYISDNWILGVVLEDATIDNYDYKNSNGSFYLITRYDVYYKGQKVGELGRTDYYFAYDRGAYLYVKDKAGQYHYFNQQMQESGYDSSAASSEYHYKNKKYWHCGSGMEAFAPGCTLTKEEVGEYMKAIGNYMYDLQGNKLFDVSMYDNVSSWNGEYARVKRDGKFGLIDRAGNLVIPCEYDDIPYDTEFFAGGYQSVVKDGKAGYVDKNGNVTCEFRYSAGIMKRFYPSLGYLIDMEGNCVVLSGAVGELPTRYKEVNRYSTLFAAVDMNGNAGVVDLYGNVIIPFDGTYDSTYDFDISADGKVIMASKAYNEHQIFVVGMDEAEETADDEIVLEDETVAQAGANGAWTCSCGAENTGNFCITCGSAKPVVEEKPAEPEEKDGSWKCVCGSENTGNFCPVCGTAKPTEPEKLKCKNCGYEPDEGTTPKFCMQCGTAF